MAQPDAICSGRCRPDTFRWQLDHIAHLDSRRRNFELVDILPPGLRVATGRLAAGYCLIAGLALIPVAGAVENGILEIHISLALKSDKLALGPAGIGLSKAVWRGERRLNAACLIGLIGARHHDVFEMKLLGVVENPEPFGDFPIRPQPRSRKFDLVAQCIGTRSHVERNRAALGVCRGTDRLRAFLRKVARLSLTVHVRPALHRNPQRAIELALDRSEGAVGPTRVRLLEAMRPESDSESFQNNFRFFAGDLDIPDLGVHAFRRGNGDRDIIRPRHLGVFAQADRVAEGFGAGWNRDS